MNEKILKLTNVVYKILEYFPESDPLRNRAKDRALAIMSVLSESALDKDQYVNEDIDVLIGYFWIAKSQGWVSSSNYLIIANEYEKLKPDKSPKGHFDGSATIPQQKQKHLDEDFGEKQINEKLPIRQKKILEFLSKNGKAQVMDLQAVLPKVTKRTIRRDLDSLLENSMISRLGSFNQIFYQINQKS